MLDKCGWDVCATQVVAKLVRRDSGFLAKRLLGEAHISHSPFGVIQETDNLVAGCVYVREAVSDPEPVVA